MLLVTDDMLRIAPPPPVRIALISCLRQKKRPLRSVAISSSNALSVPSAISLSCSVPAFVDRAVEASVRFERAGNERLDLLLAGDVRLREVDLPPALTDLLGSGRACRCVHVAADDGRPGPREGLGEDSAAAAGSSGDQDDFALEGRHRSHPIAGREHVPCARP
jgi:hypothetical protein